jgi:galactonate dehydratase
MDMGFTAVGYDPVMPMGSFDPRQLSLGELERAEKMTRETSRGRRQQM